MNTKNILPEKKSTKDPTYGYIFAAACILFLHIIFRYSAQFLHEQLLIVPCLLLVGTKLSLRNDKITNQIPLPAILMVVWFLFLQEKRCMEINQYSYIGPFLATFLFAFPAAFLMQDSDTKKTLKIFAGAYFAAATVLALEGLSLILDCLPAFLSNLVWWDGSRLLVIWHPNVLACYFMIGIAFGIAFFAQTKSLFAKFALSLPIGLMLFTLALTNCRTAIILTSGYLGASIFLTMVKRRKRWFIPGVLIALAVLVGLYGCAKHLYQANSDALIRKYTQQYQEQTASPSEETPATDPTVAEEQAIPDATDVQETTLPIEINSDTGEVSLVTQSPQGTLMKNLGSLNGRTRIWRSAFKAIRDNPAVLYWGTHSPSDLVSPYHTYYLYHMHNAWIECLVRLGLVGFIIAAIFTLQAFWNCLTILLINDNDVWKRTVALLTLCLLASAVVEPYLFYVSIELQAPNFLFFLCAGYLAHWQKGFNKQLLITIRNKIPFLKK